MTIQQSEQYNQTSLFHKTITKYEFININNLTNYPDIFNSLCSNVVYPMMNWIPLKNIELALLFSDNNSILFPIIYDLCGDVRVYKIYIPEYIKYIPDCIAIFDYLVKNEIGIQIQESNRLIQLTTNAMLEILKISS